MAFGADAARHRAVLGRLASCHTVMNGFQDSRKQRGQAGICQAIEDIRAFAIVVDQAGVAEHGQLLRYVGLWLAQQRGQMAHALAVLSQYVQYLQAHWVRQQLK